MKTSSHTMIHAALASLLLALVLGPAAGFAQNPVGAVAGQGREGDVAVIRNPRNGFSREIKIGKNGRFQARNLPVASYEVLIRHADGSEEAARRVDVHIGRTALVE